MANQLTYLNKKVGVETSIIKRFSCLLSGNYAQGGAIGVPGETLSFNTAGYTGKPNRRFLPGPSPAGTTPAASDFAVFQLPGGYTAVIEQNSGATPTPNNMVIRIFNNGAELAAGAYPAVLTSEPFVIECRVPAKYN
jgi:hypothetical protein